MKTIKKFFSVVRQTRPIVLFSVVAGLYMFFFGCVDIPEYFMGVQKFEDIRGTIVLSGSQLSSYTPELGRFEPSLATGSVNRGHFFCALEDDTILLVDNGYNENQPIFKYRYPDDVYSDSSTIGKNHSIVWEMDYDSSTARFVMDGEIDGKSSEFLLSRDLRIMEDISSHFSCTGSSHWDSTARARNWLADGSILYSCGNIFYSTNRTDRILDDTLHFALEAVSRDRMTVALSKRKLGLFCTADIKTGKVKRLKTGDMAIISAAFSPDGRYLAFIRNTYDLVMTRRLYIYDLKTDSCHYTGIPTKGDLYWGMFR